MARQFTRRELIKLLGSGGVMVFAGGCKKLRRGIQDNLDQFTEHTLVMERLTGEREDKIEWKNRTEEWKNTTCMLCDSRCGLNARVIDKNLVFLKGLMNHPVNAGGICPLGIAGLQYQYSPERLITPKLKMGERGGKVWENIGVRKAMDIIDTVLKEISGKQGEVVFVSDEHDTIRAMIIKYFLNSFGSNIVISTNVDKNLRVAVKSHFNIDSVPLYDIENSDYILSFGFDFLSYSENFMHYQKSYSLFRSGTGEKGKHVQVESRLSLTGGKSDWWIPIRPCSEHLLAQGIAYVLVRERLYKTSFVNNYLDNFDYFMTELLKNTELEYISKMTGVEVGNIIRLAKELANSRAPVCLAGPQLYLCENAVQKISAVFTLNLLLGRIEQPGGMLFEDNSFVDELEERIFGKKLNVNYTSWEYLNNKSDFFKDKIVFITENNPFKFLSFNSEIIDSLKKARFICYWGQYQSDITNFVDLVVPDMSFLERNDISLSSRGFKYPVISEVNKLVETEYETIDLTEYLTDKLLKWNKIKWDLDGLIRRIKEEIFYMRRGNVFSADRRSSIIDILENQGFWHSRYKNADEFIADLNKNGSWWDPYYNYGAYGSKIRTVNGRVDFKKIYTMLTEHKKEVSEKEKDYPLTLVPVLSSYLGIDGKGAGIPWVYEITGLMVHEMWSLWVEINPLTGEKLGLRDGSKVKIVSPSGSIVAKVKFFEGAHPECVNILFGAGTSSFGRYAEEFNGCVHSLFNPDDIFKNDSPNIFSTKVRIEKL